MCCAPLLHLAIIGLRYQASFGEPPDDGPDKQLGSAPFHAFSLHFI